MNINIEFLLAGDIDLDNPNSLRALDLELIKESNAIEYIGYHNNISDLIIQLILFACHLIERDSLKS